jgi:hypothetical protein
MANTDVMIDLETLATSTDAAILTIGAVKFDPFGKDVEEPAMDSFYVRVNIDSCNDINLHVDDGTIEWWANQDAAVKEEAFGDGADRVHIREAMERLYKFCWGAKRVWSNGAAFDIPICETAFKRLNKAVPWSFWQVRDVRTAFDLGINPNRPPVTKHHALEDAWNQAVGVQNVYNTLRSCSTYDGKFVTPFSNER